MNYGEMKRFPRIHVYGIQSHLVPRSKSEPIEDVESQDLSILGCDYSQDRNSLEVNVVLPDTTSADLKEVLEDKVKLEDELSKLVENFIRKHDHQFRLMALQIEQSPAKFKYSDSAGYTYSGVKALIRLR